MRKFVSLTFSVLMLALIPPKCLAQCVVETISVSRVQGTIFDSSGQPIPNAEVSLRKNGVIIAKTTTNNAGGFSMPAGAGDYDLQANAQGFAPGFAPIAIGKDLVRVVKPTHIWMILDVGKAQLDSCEGLTTTSHKQFEKALKRGPGN